MGVKSSFIILTFCCCFVVRFLEEYEKQGVTFWSLTLQNEPSTGLVPMYDFQCMYLGPNISKEFIKQDLGPTLVARGYGDLKYMILDDQRWFLPQWARSVSITIQVLYEN